MTEKSRSAIVKERWNFLIECLKSASRPIDQRPSIHSPTQSTPVFRSSVRRFESFGLFEHESYSISEPEADKDKNSPESSDSNVDWEYEYLAYVAEDTSLVNRLTVTLRLYRQLPSLHDLCSFNNTGNVCVWPSEECLAWYLIESANNDSFSSVRNICELGSGMTALAGLVCSILWSNLDYVFLTDGNERAVSNLSSVVDLNGGRYLARCVEAGVLRWGLSESDNSKCDLGVNLHPLAGQFDLILCADCLFFEDSHIDLINTIDLLMEPLHGRCIVVAPERTGSFERFRNLASLRFPYVYYTEWYSPRVSARHKELLAMSDTGYNSDLHYPKMFIIARRGDDLPDLPSHCP